ncbi:hypothetical protein, conserved [Eimeria maxima]|uniref:SET domain-containing protein n=1 Tax=Eimeria maxima TaxID=5804 RepID=U6MCG0_EIMMA|nr:hypothetical protein, conserved [Eimeria maxima]CDJ60748.1 hypothetical protein, conserved [Eimeria maxima]
MFPLFRKLWEASDKSALQLPSDGSRGVVPLEVWKLRPSAELSGQLKLWGNAALARGRPAAAASLYTAGILLLPNSESSTSPSSSSSLLAVLSANASLVLLRLGKAKRALRTATEAVAADPRYRKAWHRRAAALVHLRCELERYFLASRSTSSTCNSESSIDRSTSSCSRAARACLEQLDREIADAQMISQGQANDSDAAAAASRMMVGCCGCDCNAALRPPSESKGCSASHSPGLWLRKDVSVQLDAKGWGLVTANDALSTMESDPCLVLEEEAFAVYVHPKLCAAVPKIPFSLPASFTVATAQDPVGLKLHPDVALRDEWEARVEEGAEDKKESEENHDRDEERHGVSLLKEEMDGVCAGCATLPVRQDGSANECYRQGLHSWQSVLSSILFPTVPVVPCGSCAAALFCCRSCRAASSHKRICGSQQQQYLQQEGCGLEPSAGHGDNRKEEEEAAANTLETPVQPLALALPDPHRHIARQLLASVLAPSAALGKQADGANSAALAKAPIQAAGELSTTPDCAGLSILGEPPWCQLQMRTSSTVVDSTRVADWLLNAAWLAGEAAAFGRGLHCGGRCLICRPNGKKAALLSRPASAAATTSPLAAATDPPLSLDGTVTEQLGGCCCVCCRAWCPECSVRSSTLQGSDGSTHCLVPFPRCLFSAALHVYGVACCNSFTIRVLCDPEDEGVAAGTAVFLAASLINHSCAPNAIAAFGEPGDRLQWRQQRREKALGLHKDADSPPAQRFDLLPSPRGVGRGVLLQIRLCAPQNSEGGRLQEICISYGSMIGLPKSSWGFRQDWMLKHAGFFCRCEVGVHLMSPDAAAFS